jgi:hypothetical protein
MPDNPSRRHVLTALATIGLAVAASPALTPGLSQAIRPVGAPLAPPRPVNKIYAAAKAGLERVSARVAHPELVAVADFSRPSSEPRLHLVDMKSGQIDSLRVAHGKGSDPRRTGWLSHFSNAPGSDCTSEGAFLTGPYYTGEHGRSMRVMGLDPTNSNAESRAIVIHPAWYASPQVVSADGMMGRSDGCFAVSQADAERLLARLAPGHLLLATRLS